VLAGYSITEQPKVLTKHQSPPMGVDTGKDTIHLFISSIACLFQLAGDQQYIETCRAYALY